MDQGLSVACHPSYVTARYDRLPSPEPTTSTIASDECGRLRNDRSFKYPRRRRGSSGTGPEIRYNFEGNFEIATLRG